MERKLHSPAFKAKINSIALEADGTEIDASALFLQTIIDKPALVRHIRQSLQTSGQITLAELIKLRPLEYGLAELVVYLQLASETFRSVTDESAIDCVDWEDERGIRRGAQLQRLIFVR